MTTAASMTTELFSDDTGLIVVDLQHDFADPDGSLYVDGGEQIVVIVNELVDAAHQAGATVVYTQDWHPPRTPHFDIDGGIWPVHCVQDTWGAELHRDLSVASDAQIVRKGVDGGDGYSGFSVRDPVSGSTTATELGGILEARNIARLVVVGLAGDVCVKATALDGQRMGWEVTVPLNATRFVELSDGDAQRAIDDLKAADIRVVDRLTV